MRLSVIVGDQGWYWSGRADGTRAYQRWGVWGSRGAEAGEDFATPQAAQAKVEEWATERRQLGYEDDPREEWDFFDQISLGPWVPLPAEVFAKPAEPEVVRELKERRSVACFAVHPSGQKVLLAMGGEILECATKGGAKRVVIKKFSPAPAGLLYLNDPYFAVTTYQGVQLYDDKGLVIGDRLPGGEYLVAIRGCRVLVTAGTMSSITTVAVYGLDKDPSSAFELGRFELKWTDDGPGLAGHQDEAYVIGQDSGCQILHVDEAYGLIRNPPPQYPPGLKSITPEKHGQ